MDDSLVGPICEFRIHLLANGQVTVGIVGEAPPPLVAIGVMHTAMTLLQERAMQRPRVVVPEMAGRGN